MKTQRVGLLLLVVAAVLAGLFVWKGRGTSSPAPPGRVAPNGGGAPVTAADAVTVKGYVGGEKLGFLADPDVQKILRDKYGVTVDGTKLGSIEMVQGSTQGQDFLWPSSQVALELYKSRGGKFQKADVVFNSPIVFYSWDVVTEALIKNGVVQKLGASYYVVDAPKFIRMINTGTSWKQIGLPELYGRVSVRSTDPTKSNSGMMFAGLLANITNGGEVVDDTTLPKSLPEVKTFFGRLGYLEPSSADLFNQFLSMGEGANPMIVGYENQLTEFNLENPQYRDLLRKRIRILYPRPTVWSNHPLIALTDSGVKLLNALKDPEIQKLAWEHHGFRSGLVGVQNDPSVLQVVGIPAQIQNVVPMPTPQVMQKIIDSLGKS